LNFVDVSEIPVCNINRGLCSCISHDINGAVRLGVSCSVTGKATAGLVGK